MHLAIECTVANYSINGLIQLRSHSLSLGLVSFILILHENHEIEIIQNDAI